MNPELKRSTYIQTVFDKDVITPFQCFLVIIYAWPASEATIQKNVRVVIMNRWVSKLQTKKLTTNWTFMNFSVIVSSTTYQMYEIQWWVMSIGCSKHSYHPKEHHITNFKKRVATNSLKKMIIYEPISIQYTREEWKLMMGFWPAAEMPELLLPIILLTPFSLSLSPQRVLRIIFKRFGTHCLTPHQL